MQHWLWTKYRTAKRSWPPSVRLWRSQHNGRRLWTTGFERRTPFTTADSSSGETTVSSVDNSCGLTPSRTRGRIYICTYFVFETRLPPSEGGICKSLCMRQQNQRCQRHNSIG